MKNYRCKHCKEEFELSYLYVSKKWYLVKPLEKKWGYFVKCPHCHISSRIKFLKLPFNVKMHFINKWFEN